MTLTCATCDRPFNRALARHTLDGYTHVICPPRPRGLPIDPLAPYLDRITQWPSSNRLRDAVDKAIRRGAISIHLADRVAIALGLHPALIWGEDWWVPVDGEVAA